MACKTKVTVTPLSVEAQLFGRMGIGMVLFTSVPQDNLGSGCCLC